MCKTLFPILDVRRHTGRVRSMTKRRVGTDRTAPGVARKNHTRAADPKRILASRARVGVRARDIFDKFVADRKCNFETIVRRSAAFILMKTIIVRSQIAFAVDIKTIAGIGARVARDDIFLTRNADPARRFTARWQITAVGRIAAAVIVAPRISDKVAFVHREIVGTPTAGIVQTVID